MAHVMLVEDDEATRYATQRALEQAGHAVAPFGDPDAALDALTQLPPDVLVLDYGFRGTSRDGSAIADRARALRRDVRVIFMTGYPDAAVVLSRCYLVLPKPVNMGRLLAAVRAATLHVSVDAVAPRG
ncbi:MAG: hypothetical protein BGO51_04980 [Rhodospirillales bacterium 69-11]|nr:response regulator [Rhodospirillales bacterium]OJW27098.1 MAG: hypothetical protein BGO51_04980 [Rhodospirillales bacterium 69-11]